MEKQKTTGGQSFIYGATIMVVSTAIVKVLGALFRIPLANLIGEDGMGFYSTAYDVYLPIYALAMAGLPVAVSRLTAQYVQRKRYADARQTLKTAKLAFLVTGLTGFLLLMLISYPFIYITGNQGSLYGIFAIAPSVLCCCVMSSYRGYYEGLRNMYPTAISTIIEGAGKLILGYGFAFLIMRYYGNPSVNDALFVKAASMAAAGALFGITLGTAFGALFLIVRHKVPGDGMTAEMLIQQETPDSGKKILRSLITIAVPVVLGSLVTNVASLIDVTMVQRQLTAAVEQSPEVFHKMYAAYLEERTDADIPNFLYGIYKGYAFTLYNLVPTITSVIGVSALPVLAMSWVKNDKQEIKKNVESMVRVTSLLAMPCGIGLVALAKPILALLFNAATVDISAKILMILGITAIFAGIMSPINNMLQAIDRQWVPVRNIAVGAAIKIVVNLILVRIPQINIYGAPIGTLCCYIYICVANVVCITKYSGVHPNIVSALLRPFAASLVCGAAAYFSNMLLCNVINAKIAVILAIIVAGIAYLAALIIFRAYTTEDLLSFPKGDKIVKIFEKFDRKSRKM
ncbi:MAG: polysaccharide biosynthesis protein [Oscillospiraceae bacterium]|nr:polysaccharide biosynthesis protein [Candidatus Equicaccousia limihippi]